MTPEEQTIGSLAHLSGYVNDATGTHPVLYFVRNVEMNEADGTYVAGGPFLVSEDFWARDRGNPDVRATLGAGGYQLYINGYPDGRVAYLALLGGLSEFLKAVWAHPGWRFRPPGTLEETAHLLEMHLQIIGTLFELSDYPAPYIGGDIGVATIPAPWDQSPLE